MFAASTSYSSALTISREAKRVFQIIHFLSILSSSPFFFSPLCLLSLALFLLLLCYPFFPFCFISLFITSYFSSSFIIYLTSKGSRSSSQVSLSSHQTSLVSSPPYFPSLETRLIFPFFRFLKTFSPSFLLRILVAWRILQ